MSIETVHLSEEERCGVLEIDPKRFSPEGAAERAFKEARKSDYFMKWLEEAPVEVGTPPSSKLIDAVNNLADAEVHYEYIQHQICIQKRLYQTATTEQVRNDALALLQNLTNDQKSEAIKTLNEAFLEFKSFK